MTTEHAIMNDVRLAASDAGWTMFRNNVGMGWTGDAEHLPDRSVLIRNARPLHAGLCKGSSDLIGFRPLVVTAEHIGQTIAQFAAVEIKGYRGRATEPQRNFLRVVQEAGGVAILARSAEDLRCAV